MARTEELHQKILPFLYHDTACLIIQPDMKMEAWNYYHRYYTDKPIVHLYLVGLRRPDGKYKEQVLDLSRFNLSQLESIYFYGHLAFKIEKMGECRDLKTIYFDGEKDHICVYPKFMPLEIREKIKTLYLNNVALCELSDTFPNVEKIILDITLLTHHMTEGAVLGRCRQMKELNFIGRFDLLPEKEKGMFDYMISHLSEWQIQNYPKNVHQPIQVGNFVIQHYDYFCSTLYGCHLRWKIVDERRVLIDPNLPSEELEKALFRIWMEID